MNPASIYYAAMKERSRVGDKNQDFYPDVSMDEDLIALTEASQDSQKIEE